MSTPVSTRSRPLPWERGRREGPLDGRTRIVVVCTANLARSPLVERLLQADLDARLPGGFAVSSAGSRVLEARGMADGARRLLAEAGLDGGGHRARPLQAAHLDGAALVLTAEADHAVAVLDRAPALLNRTFTVLEFAAIVRHHRARGLDRSGLLARAATLRAAVASDDHDLIDPVGDGADRFTVLRQQLGDAVPVIAEALVASRG